MALPYPEGIVYFKSAALKQSGYDATNEKDFYGNFLVEYIWNDALFAADDFNKGTIQDHVRSGKIHTGYGVGYGTKFGVFDKMYCSFGEDRQGHQITRQAICDTNTNFNEVRDRDAGGPLKTRLSPVPMGPETYAFIDLVVQIRAVYFPVAAKAGAVNQDLCSYLMVDFRLRKGVSMRSQSTGNRYDIPFDNLRGLGKGHDRIYQSLVFNVPGIYTLLSLPPQLRNIEKGLYVARNDGEELINLMGAGAITGTTTNTTHINFYREIDLAHVIADNFGVDITWTPYEYSSWVADFITNVTTLGLGYIPIAGPLISVAFSLGLTAITDPDFFKADNVLGVTTNIMNAVLASALNMKSNLAPGFLGKRMAVK